MTMFAAIDMQTNMAANHLRRRFACLSLSRGFTMSRTISELAGFSFSLISLAFSMSSSSLRRWGSSLLSTTTQPVATRAAATGDAVAANPGRQTPGGKRREAKASSRAATTLALARPAQGAKLRNFRARL